MCVWGGGVYYSDRENQHVIGLHYEEFSTCYFIKFCALIDLCMLSVQRISSIDTFIQEVYPYSTCDSKFRYNFKCLHGLLKNKGSFTMHIN